MTQGVAFHIIHERGPALSGRVERDAYEWDAIAGSERLRDAIGSAVMRFASSQRMSIAEANAMLFGSEPRGTVRRIRPSVTDYTGHRPREIVARPIGEIIEPIVASVLGRGIAG